MRGVMERNGKGQKKHRRRKKGRASLALTGVGKVEGGGVLLRVILELLGRHGLAKEEGQVGQDVVARRRHEPRCGGGRGHVDDGALKKTGCAQACVCSKSSAA